MQKAFYIWVNSWSWFPIWDSLNKSCPLTCVLNVKWKGGFYFVLLVGWCFETRSLDLVKAGIELVAILLPPKCWHCRLVLPLPAMLPLWASSKLQLVFCCSWLRVAGTAPCVAALMTLVSSLLLVGGKMLHFACTASLDGSSDCHFLLSHSWEFYAK